MGVTQARSCLACSPYPCPRPAAPDSFDAPFLGISLHSRRRPPEYASASSWDLAVCHLLFFFFFSCRYFPGLSVSARETPPGRYLRTNSNLNAASRLALPHGAAASQHAPAPRPASHRRHLPVAPADDRQLLLSWAVLPHACPDLAPSRRGCPLKLSARKSLALLEQASQASQHPSDLRPATYRSNPTPPRLVIHCCGTNSTYSTYT